MFGKLFNKNKNTNNNNNNNQSYNSQNRAMSSKSKKGKKKLNEVIDSVPLFNALSAEERKKLAKGLKQHTFKKGQYLMKQGESGDSFYIIDDGIVDVLVEKGQNKFERVASLEPGDYAGEQALLQNAQRNASLVAVSDNVITYVCSQKTFKSIVAKNVQFGKRVPKRNAFMTYINYDDVKKDEDEKQEKLPEQTINWLLDCVEENLLFAKLSIEQRRKVLQYMQLINVKCGQFVINQGDEHEKASTFYVVESGEYNVLVDGVPVHKYKRGGTFGELALLHNAPRAASIACISDNDSSGGNKLWVISRKHFRYALIQSSKKRRAEYVEFFGQVPLFQNLPREVWRVCNEVLEEERFINKKDRIVIGEGNVVNEESKFYIVKKGKLKAYKGDDKKNTVKEFGIGDIFGEKALNSLAANYKKGNKNEEIKRAATVYIATNDETILLRMDFKPFRDFREYPQVLEIFKDLGKAYDAINSGQKLTRRKESPNKTQQQPQNGNKTTRTGKRPCKLKELKTIGVLGKGGFGLVTLVKDPHTNKSYALKAIKKYQVIELELQKHIESEKEVMLEMNNKFLVNLWETYNDKLRVYFLLDVCLGGELFTILRGRRYFNEPTARFFAASVVEGFAYMHSKNIIYRDLKPENLVLDSKGYLKIADFGFAKKLIEEEGMKTYTLCGTPDYLCPEIVTGQGHGKGCDWWTLGILIYEMLASFPPFVADEPIETYRKIIRGRIRFPRYFSQEVRDLIRGLLHNKPGRRLGVMKHKGINEPADSIRKHPWYSNFDWDALNNGKLPAPIQNKVRSETDLSNFQQIEVDDEDARPIDAKLDFGKKFETMW